MHLGAREPRAEQRHAITIRTDLDRPPAHSAVDARDLSIVRDGAEIGAWCVLNVNRPMARIVLLPASVPLAARVFVLAMG